MTSAAYKSAGTGRHAEGRGFGLVIFATVGVFAGNQLARWFGVAVLGLNAIDQMFFLSGCPFWSLTIIAADIIAICGLCAYGSRANVEAAA